MPAYVVFLIVLVFYVFCGCIMDIASILIITIPIVVPLLVSVGYDPYVLVIILVFVGEMAGLTPPIGMNVFAVASEPIGDRRRWEEVPEDGFVGTEDGARAVRRPLRG